MRIEVEMGLGLLAGCYYSWGGQWMSSLLMFEQRPEWKVGVACTSWRTFLVEVVQALNWESQIKEASMGIVQWARNRVIEMRSERAEAAKSEGLRGCDKDFLFYLGGSEKSLKYFSWRNNYFQRIVSGHCEKKRQGKHGNRNPDRRQESRGKVMVTKTL